MHLLVTGGCGFIGSNFLRGLLRSDPARTGLQRLVNLDALTYAGNPANLGDVAGDPRYQFVKGDIADEGLVEQLLREQGVEAVVHFAAESHVDRSIDSPEPFFVANGLGTLRLLNAVRRHWRTLSPTKAAAFRFLHVSTDEVFGSLVVDEPPFSETSPYAPNSPYAASKAASDHLVRAFAHTYGLPTLTTHCSNNYGPYQFPEKLIPLMTLNALEGRPLPVYGDGAQVRDWLYVEDHCEALWLVLRSGKIGETYAIGGRNQRTNIELVRLLCTSLDRLKPRADGASYASQITFVPDRPGHDRRYAIDCSKIQRDLGWAPKQSFESGLEKTLSWYLAHRDWAAAITSGTYARERLGTTGLL